MRHITQDSIGHHLSFIVRVVIFFFIPFVIHVQRLLQTCLFFGPSLPVRYLFSNPPPASTRPALTSNSETVARTISSPPRSGQPRACACAAAARASSRARPLCLHTTPAEFRSPLPPPPVRQCALRASKARARMLPFRVRLRTHGAARRFPATAHPENSTRRH